METIKDIKKKEEVSKVMTTLNEFKDFVTKQFEDFDEFGETDLQDYIDAIIEKAIELFWLRFNKNIKK
jgi:hypothetical protein